MVRFNALVEQRGQNSLVGVPDTVSKELLLFADAGRIRVSARLAGAESAAEFHATLVPVGAGGHILYLPGGVRGAAGVRLGDTVSLEVQPLGPQGSDTPSDLASALGAAAGAEAAWDLLPASQRRELVRFLEGARTPGSRERRAGQIVAQVLGRTVPPPGTRTGRELWKCPSCGRSFVTRNMYHSCVDNSLEEAFLGMPDTTRELFTLVRRTVETFGPVTLVPYADRIAFMVRVRFCGARPRKRWLDVDFWLTRRAESPRFHKIESLTPYTHIHTVRLTDPSEVDAELAAWLREAYAVGCQEHLRPARA